MNHLKKIHIGVIFRDVIKCFFISCGIVLLLFFFYYQTIPFTKDGAKQSVLLVFVVLICFRIIYEVVSQGANWFYEPKTVFISEGSNLKAEHLFNESKEVTDYNQKVTAIHEAGHAVMAYLMNIENFYVSVSNIAPMVKLSSKQYTADSIESIILITYSGAIAEELLLGKLHYGCIGSSESDFSKATELIKAYIVMTNSDVSKTLLNEELSMQTITLSKQFYQRAKNILINNKEMIADLSKELVKKDFLTKEEVNKLLGEKKNDCK